jgi:hypothetical protein
MASENNSEPSRLSSNWKPSFTSAGRELRLERYRGPRQSGEVHSWAYGASGARFPGRRIGSGADASQDPSVELDCFASGRPYPARGFGSLAGRRGGGREKTASRYRSSGRRPSNAQRHEAKCHPPVRRELPRTKIEELRAPAQLLMPWPPTPGHGHRWNGQQAIARLVRFCWYWGFGTSPGRAVRLGGEARASVGRCAG